VVRGALLTAIVAEVISCGSTRREIRRAGCWGVYPADEARLLREQHLRKAGQEQLVLNDALFHAGVVWCAARASAMASSVVDAAAGGWQKARVFVERIP
jgi:hypothetical protein